MDKELIDEAVRDICKASVAPASKSAVRAILERVVQSQREEFKKLVNELLDIEFDCIESANALTPNEKTQCQKVVRNIRRRLQTLNKE